MPFTKGVSTHSGPDPGRLGHDLGLLGGGRGVVVVVVVVGSGGGVVVVKVIGSICGLFISRVG